jgi:hypothetical protein
MIKSALLPLKMRGNTGGFAIVEIIAALAILSATLIALMTMVQYARVRAVINYQDRYVLLRVDGELQRIKYNHHITNSIALPATLTFAIPQLNEHGRQIGTPPTVTVRFTSRHDWDTQLFPALGYYNVTAIAEWDVRLPFSIRGHRTEKRFIQLREDYFY